MSNTEDYPISDHTQLEDLRREVHRLHAARASWLHDYRTLNSKIDQLTSELAKLRHTNQELQARIDALTESSSRA